jgi:PAS domain S-box-containing protein
LVTVGFVEPRCSVVVADDAAEVRALVRAQLRLSGRYAVVGEAGTGLEAIEVCREQQPDLVLLDVSMPDLDGFGALPEIRKVAPGARIVVYTGFEERGLAERARELGADALIEKSTAAGALADQLDALGIGAATDGPPAQSSPAEDDAGDDVLHEHLERFREVFEEAAIGIATMTLTGRVVRANRALGELVARPIGELVGIPYAALVPESDRPAVQAALRRAQQGRGAVVQFEHDVAGGDSSWRVSSTAAPVRDARGRPLYLFVQTQDVTAQRRAEEELRQSEQRFRLLVEAVRDYAIFMLDPDGRVASWNTGAERIKGYRAAEIIGQHFRIFYPPDMQAIRHPEHELELALENGSYEEEGWRIRKDGSRFWASVVITAVFGADGEHIGFAKVTRNIEERRRMLLDAEDAAAELAAANAELEAANARLVRDAADQAQFLAVTAHELRSPVSVLSGSAQLLVDHWKELQEDERVELGTSMTTSAARVQRLLSDLLTAARLEAQVERLSLQEFDLADVLARTVKSARAAETDAEIRLDAPPGLYVRGDPDRLAQAVDNLLNNAVRHGSPPVLVRGRSLGDRVEVTVSDHGRGVPAELRDRLFARFATGSGRGGTGLGLYIVRALARAHGGDAWYEDGEDGLPTFVLTIPARPGDVP